MQSRVQELKRVVAAHEGRNVADTAFARQVEELLDLFYADIGEIKRIDLRALFDLFLLKALYVQRRSTSAAALDYLGDLLVRHLRMRDIFPVPDLAAHYAQLLERMLEETEEQMRHAQNLFEAHRNIADSTLFLLGLFPASLTRRRSGFAPNAAAPRLDRSFYHRLGRQNYARASEHELARWTGQDLLLARLAAHFDLYVAALNEVAETYVHAYDVHRIADQMLDSFNAYRRTGDPKHLENARKYAAILAIDRRAFPRLWRSRRSYILLN